MIIFGDFNNRLVCWEELAQHVSFIDEEKKVPVLSPEGAKVLCEKIRDPAGRKELFTSKDSWFYHGKDALGTHVSPPAACVKVRELFDLHTDVVNLDDIPLPTYKRTPIGEQLSQQAGIPLEPTELLVGERLQSNIQCLTDARLFDDLAVTYFGWEQRQRRVLSPKSGGPPLLECGWPDGIGIYRFGRGAHAEFMHWCTHDSLCSGDHVPTKGMIKLVTRGRNVGVYVNSVI